MKPLFPSVALTLALLIAAGCGPGSPPVAAPPAPNGAGGDSVTEVPLRVASWDEVEQQIAAQQGKVVVLDVWSTWCQPCMREFPGLVKLHREHGERVACISLNSNYTGAADEPPEDALEKVKAFLVQQGATFENFISSTPDLELYPKLDSPSVPIVRVYDKTGTLRKQFDDSSGEYGQEGFTYEEHIAPLVEELLAE